MPAPFSGGRPRVVIVGSGFGGLRVARALGGKPVDVVLVDRQNYHLFQPLLYQVATAGLEPDQIAHPVRGIVRRLANVRFVMTEVTGIDSGRHVITTSDGELGWDYLVLSGGSATNFFGVRSIEQNAFELKDLRDATDIRNQILTLFEKAAAEPDPARRSQMLTFCVVGGGPTGVEFAGALSELIRLVLVKDYPGLDLSSVHVLLIESGGELLQSFPRPLQESARRVLESKKVEIRFGTRVTGYENDQVLLSEGAPIPCCTLLWAAGVRGVTLGETLGVALARQSRVPVTESLTLADNPRIFVIGDLAHFEVNGAPLPMLATVAMQMGTHAARNILRAIRDEPLAPFQYRDPGSLATIGRNQAVAVLGRSQFTGFVGWILWLVIHIANLIGFRNRIVVLVNWAWDYFFFDRAIRIITRQPRG